MIRMTEYQDILNQIGIMKGKVDGVDDMFTRINKLVDDDDMSVGAANDMGAALQCSLIGLQFTLIKLYEDLLGRMSEQDKED